MQTSNVPPRFILHILEAMTWTKYCAVRGMMYYKQALIIQGMQEGASGVGMRLPYALLLQLHISPCEVSSSCTCHLVFCFVMKSLQFC
jgi:hypothetical protein